VWPQPPPAKSDHTVRVMRILMAGAALYVGRHVGEPLTDDLPGSPPHTFTGGTIEQLAIDVSGDAYVDLEREAALMLMRE
jgi:hypothetical protein